MISTQVPGHLLAAARVGFLATAVPAVPSYAPIAQLIPMGVRSLDFVDIGGSPMPTNSRGRLVGQDFIEKKMTVTPKDWDITVSISANAIDDDQTGTLERKVRAAGDNFQRHISNLAFKALNDGDATTNFGAGYDNLAFYSASHIDAGGQYQTVQSNVNNLALSLDNFETVMVAAGGFRQDQGEFTGYNYDTLVVPPALARLAAQITGNAKVSGTANNDINPYAGITKYIVNPQLDSTAWFLVASGESIKPIIVVMRKEPSLQSAWFDPHGDDGGTFWFKFFARYNHFYGDWRLAVMGRS
jgi:phage major head subunit gpT-like protein